MSAMSPTHLHASNHRLILHILGQSDEELAAHLEVCDTCRSQTEAYRSVVAATRRTLSAASGKVNLVSLEETCVLESTECDVGDSQHTLRVTLNTSQDALHGRLTVDETCTCWYDAPVRLFGPNGLVASGRVNANREFHLPTPESGRPHSLGLVLTRHGMPELQIIGSFQVR